MPYFPPAAANGWEWESPELSWANFTQVVVNHNLGVIPKNWKIVFRCKIAQHDYAVDDEVEITRAYFDGAGMRGVSVAAKANSFEINVANAPIIDTGISSFTGLTAANWRIVMRASR